MTDVAARGVSRSAERWGTALREWAIPERILARAHEPPYGYPTECFRSRAERSAARDPTPTTLHALEALPDGGSVLDVGVGGGATSLPLASHASRITGVDASEDMLDAFRQTTSAIDVEHDTALGTWPDVASSVPPADVVVCGHVLYNVQALEPFVLSLTDHARRRVVVEITGSHPWAWMNDLWMRFHGLARPSGPTSDDAEEVLLSLGFAPRREDRVVEANAQPPSGFQRRADAVALIRRRLCLGPERDGEVRDILGERLAERYGLWSAGPAEQAIVTLWWDPER
jgi:SAM-dependent methyltransferase